MDAREWHDDIIFLRKVVAGRSDRSYGIQVARLAGLPRAVVERAQEILGALEHDELTRGGRPSLSHTPTEPQQQLGLFQALPSAGERLVERLLATRPEPHHAARGARAARRPEAGSAGVVTGVRCLRCEAGSAPWPFGRSLLGAVLAFVASPATAASVYQPRLAFRVLATPHFRIYYHQGGEAQARRLAGIAESVRAELAGSHAAARARR